MVGYNPQDDYFGDDLEEEFYSNYDGLQEHRRCLGPLLPCREMMVRRPEIEPLGAGRINIYSKHIN